ncbi:MAG TPA: HAD-IIIA family hydrolase [Rhodopila sp.]|nr:HAD-IIIA family hydrolase [Rhodopila sp.]
MTRVRTEWPQADIDGRLYSRPRQAVILAGGRGTRMQPITNHLPKPMVPVCGRPFLEYQIEQLADQGIERVLLLLGYLPEVVQRHFGDGRDWGIQIDYRITHPDQLTSSRIADARHLLDPCFMLLYCDNYWPLQMDKLWRRFCEAHKPALVTVYRNADNYSRGCVALDENQDVQMFDRTRTAPGLREVEISYAIITDTCLERLPAEDCLFEEAIYTPLARQGRLAAYVSDHRYYSVGSLNRLPETETFFRRQPTIFLDRDGVLNRKPPRAHYVRNWSEWQWNPGARQALRMLRHAGYRTVIISNQAGIGRGVMTELDLQAIHDRMRQDVIQTGGSIDAIYHCPHDWDAGCTCRKPKPGLLLQAQKELCLDLTRTPFIGDDDRDAMAAAAAGCPFYKLSETESLLDITRHLVKQRDRVHA